MQVPADHPSYDGADFSGIFVYTRDAPALSTGEAVTRGMTVDVVGTLTDFGPGQIELVPTSITASATTSAIPDAEDATTAEVAGGSRADARESVLVRVGSVSVSDVTPDPTRADASDSTTGEFEVESTLRIENFFFTIDPFVSMGESFDSITGVLMFRDEQHKLNPRDADDYIAGAPQLAGLTPDLSYAREGVTGATFPMPLTVHLTRATGTNTTVTIESSSTADLAVTDVVVPAGSASAVIPVDVPTGATPDTYTVTATLGAMMDTADVRVLGADEAPADFTLSPTTAMVPLGGMFTFTVTIDIPAPPGGAQIDLSEDTGGTLPPNVVIPEDEMSATFDYVPPAAETTGTLTAQLAGTSVTRTADLNVVMARPAVLIFSEYVEGTSYNKALEIANIGGLDADLSLCAIQRFSNGGTTPSELMLSGTLAAGDVVVVCNDGVDMADSHCDVLSSVINHNGDDAYALVCDGTVVDTFGQIGTDPGSAWTGGGLSTVDYVLRRQCTITTGDADGSDAFNPSTEWTGEAWMSASVSLAGLGDRSECP